MLKQMKKYSIESKQQALQRAQQDDMTISQDARDLSVSAAGLQRWVQ